MVLQVRELPSVLHTRQVPVIRASVPQIYRGKVFRDDPGDGCEQAEPLPSTRLDVFNFNPPLLLYKYILGRPIVIKTCRMFRPVLNSARRSAVNAVRQTRYNSSSSSSGAGGDTRWMIASVAITIPALGYLLSPPEKKAQAHKKVHAAAAEVGITDVEPEEAEGAIPEVHHGPDSRSKQSGQQQSPESKRTQAAENTTVKAKSGDDKPGREDGATKPSGGDIGSKQSGLSNTETKHMVPAVIKEGENPTAKSSNTVEPRNSRGTEKDGPSGDSQSSVMEDATPEADKKPSEVSLFSTANFYTNLQDRLRSLKRKRSPPRRSLPRRRRRTSRVPCFDKFTRKLNNICTEEIKVIVWSHIRKKNTSTQRRVS